MMLRGYYMYNYDVSGGLAPDVQPVMSGGTVAAIAVANNGVTSGDKQSPLFHSSARGLLITIGSGNHLSGASGFRIQKTPLGNPRGVFFSF